MIGHSRAGHWQALLAQLLVAELRVSERRSPTPLTPGGASAHHNRGGARGGMGHRKAVADFVPGETRAGGDAVSGVWVWCGRWAYTTRFP